MTPALCRCIECQSPLHEPYDLVAAGEATEACPYCHYDEPEVTATDGILSCPECGEWFFGDDALIVRRTA